MKRLSGLLITGLAAGTALAGVALPNIAHAEPAPPKAELQVGDAYAGIGVESEGGMSATKIPPGGHQGFDVSSHQGSVNWQKTRNDGARFGYIKATESTSYRNPYFSQQYNGSRNVGIRRGAYHFALPHTSSGAAQATYFVNNGGGWSADGWTLPGALDIEYNPYSRTNGRNTCYGLSATQMVNWIRSFSDQYRALTGRVPAIYTTTDWWTRCTGNNGGFGDHPLWLARYSSSVGALPNGWKRHTIWQYNDHGRLPGDQNTFNGGIPKLKRLALGGEVEAPVQAKASTKFATMNAKPEPVKRGERLTVKGRLQRQVGGDWQNATKQTVRIRFKKKGTKNWTTVGTDKTGAKGKFSKKFTAGKDGTWRVIFKGDSTHDSAKSRKDYVNVVKR